jgi:hypothetical protein
MRVRVSLPVVAAVLLLLPVLPGSDLEAALP